MLSSLSSISLLTTLVYILISCLIPEATAFSYHQTSIVTSQQQLYSRDSTTSIAMSSSSSTLSKAFSLQGKTALITGSSGGIGKAIAKCFAEAGADVIVHYNTRREGAISTYKEINDNKDSLGKCLGIIHSDFRDPKQINEMFEYVTNNILKDNRLDILVNNAGIVSKLAVEDDDNLSTYHETMAVNLHAPVQLMKLSHAHMKSTSSATRKGGVIINNTSIHGSRSVEYMSAYAATKSALDSLTQSLACEFAASGVRVNAIAPGVVPVERTEKAFNDQSVVDMWLPHLPVGRLGYVEDIAQATLTLATNEWCTGTIMTVDGGMMARSNMPFRPRPPKPEVVRETNEASSSTGVLFEIP